MRARAAKEAGMAEIPVIEADLTEAKELEWGLTDNMHRGEWDFDKLFAMPKELLGEVGFSEDEITKLIDGHTEAKEDDFDVDAALDDKTPPVAKLGDVWVLGEHRLVCGDATKREDVEKLMDGEKADMVFTDPPYLMDFTGGIHADGSKSFNAVHGAIKNDKMTKEEGETFLDKINEIIKDVVTGAFYITFYRLGIGEYYASFKRVGLEVRSLIIWEKGNHTLSNSDYMSRYEPMFYGWVEDHNFYGGNNGVDVWEIKRTTKNTLHPTMKPIELCAKAIKNSSKPKEIVLDLFGGSGSTLIACEQTKRRCYMSEIDPKYCDVIIKRWEKLTSKKAQKAV